MQGQLVMPDGVHLVHRIPLEKGNEIHAYFQEYDGTLMAHVRRVYVRKDGTVRHTSRGIAVPPSLLNELLQATAFLAVESGKLRV